MNTTASIPQTDSSGKAAGPPPATKPKTHPDSAMEPMFWVPPDATGPLLDVGCNTGALLVEFRHRYPKMDLAGIDINHDALQYAKGILPDVELHEGFGYELPFPSERFEYATCIEVIEHVPEQHRPQLIAEIRRVLKPGGRLILRCPHAGIFDWLDAQNFRFRFPGLYRSLVGQGNRDVHYEEAREELIWHHHFTHEELLRAAGEGWQEEACKLGGLLLFPITDILRWPFYRMKRPDHWIVKALEKVATLELGLNFGKGSYDILLVLKKS
jgi:SAM-dependent methyltransferase